MAKKKTSFGTIMTLLDISLNDISEYLHIDKTTISKWRTGGRRLTSRSPYFEPVLSFFIKRNEELLQRPLIRFLYDLYPDKIFDNPRQAYEYLKLYLSADPDEGIDSETPINPPLLSNEFLVGIDGRQRALDMVLCQAEKMMVPGTVKILEIDQMNWLCRDVIFLEKVIARLKDLAEKNFRIEFAFSSLQNSPIFMTFIHAVDTVRFQKNINKYVVNTERVFGLVPCIYLIEESCVSVGLNSDDPAIPIHTNFFSDQLNILKYSKMFDRVVHMYGNKVLVTDNAEEIDHILKTIDFFSIKKEDFLFYGSHLSVTTMKKELFLEVLTENNVFGEARERCLQYYQSLRLMMATTPPGYLGVYNLILGTLEKDLSYEYLIDSELSALTNRQIRKSPAQYRQHLKDTVDFLETNENVRAMLLTGGYQKGTPCAWVKRNMWSMAFNTTSTPSEYQIIFWDDTNLVNMAINASTHFVKSNYSVEHRQKEYNLRVLRALSQGEIL